MKNTSILIALAIVAALSITSMITSVNAVDSENNKPTVVAVVSSEAIFAGMAEKAALDADITALIDKFTEARNDKQKDLQTLQSDLDLFDEGTERYEQKLLEYEEKSIQLNSWGTIQQRKITRNQQVKLKALSTRITDAIEAYAVDAGIDIVLDKYSAIQIPNPSTGKPTTQRIRSVLYSLETLDITDPVIQKLDNEYNNRK